MFTWYWRPLSDSLPYPGILNECPLFYIRPFLYVCRFGGSPNLIWIGQYFTLVGIFGNEAIHGYDGDETSLILRANAPSFGHLFQACSCCPGAAELLLWHGGLLPMPITSIGKSWSFLESGPDSSHGPVVKGWDSNHSKGGKSWGSITRYDYCNALCLNYKVNYSSVRGDATPKKDQKSTINFPNMILFSGIWRFGNKLSVTHLKIDNI